MINTKLKKLGNVDTKGHNSLWGRVYDPNGLSSTLNSEGGGLGAKTGLYHIHQVTVQKSGIGRLTPVECNRLQGFPDNWNEKGIVNGETIKMSDTQRYRQAGNAVTVPILKMIAEKIKKEIFNES